MTNPVSTPVDPRIRKLRGLAGSAAKWGRQAEADEFSRQIAVIQAERHLASVASGLTAAERNAFAALLFGGAAANAGGAA